MIRQIGHSASVGIQYVDLIVAIPVGLKDDLHSIRRPQGKTIICRIVCQSDYILSLIAHYVKLIVAIPVLLKDNSLSIGRPGRIIVIKLVVGQFGHSGTISIHPGDLGTAFPENNINDQTSAW